MTDGTPGDRSRFSAAGPALGYLAQIDYALLLALRRLDVEDDFSVSIETLDDIVFHDGETDSATEKWQTKHSIDENRSLSDASTDLWKTLRNWAAEPAAGVRHMLLTTSPATGATDKLTTGPGRDVPGAVAALERTARTSQNNDNQEYYRVFLGLADDERRALVASVEVVDQAANAVAVVDDITRAVRRSVTLKRRQGLVDRLRGWWHGRAIQHLDLVARHAEDRITAAELEEALLSFADQLRDESLPIDVLDFPEPTDDEVSDDDRIFVEQLRLISIASPRLRKCIYDHNRAFAQRSNWQRERLLNVGELAGYDRELTEAWERFFMPLGTEDEGELSVEADVRRRAREIFQRLDTSDLPRIRRDVRTGFIASGSLHILADRLVIGWHPAWLGHLRGRLPEVRGSDEEAAA